MTRIDPKVKADALAELLPAFLQRREVDIRVLNEAMAANDLVRVAEIAHKIRGNGATFGFPELTEIAERLEFAAKQGQGVHVRRELAELEKQIGLIATRVAHPET